MLFDLHRELSIPPTTVLDARSLLRWLDQTLVWLRVALGHDHRDTAFWDARGVSARYAQSLRARLRPVANLLHVERATARGRIHGTWFATVDDQRAWLVAMEDRQFQLPPRDAGMPETGTLVQLRAGMLTPRGPI